VSTLLVVGGSVVDEERVRRADLLVRDGRVADILEPGHSAATHTTLDASGLHVLPGLVDAHVHFNEPGRTDWEGFETGGAAAAAGGVTTVVDMPLNCDPPTLDRRSLLSKQAAVAEHAVIDYALWGGVVPDSLDHLRALRDEGVVGVKAFLCDSGLPEYSFFNDDRALLDAMRRTSQLGLLLALHAEDAQLTGALGSQARALGRAEPLDWARSRPPETELRAVRRALQAARATGARLHFVHISTGQAADEIARARASGLDVSVETCPHYLALDEGDLARLGASAKCAPPLRSRPVVDGLWRALLDGAIGAIDWVASDHSPCPPDMKHGDVWHAWGGIAGVQTTLPVLLDEAVHRRGLSLSRVVTLTAANPARRLGLYPRKGALQPGSDADLTLVELDGEWILGQADLYTRWPSSPFIGRTFRGRVVATLVRGSTAYRQGEVLARPGFGRLVTPGAVPA
jgi:allantoinase